MPIVKSSYSTGTARNTCAASCRASWPRLPPGSGSSSLITVRRTGRWRCWRRSSRPSPWCASTGITVLRVVTPRFGAGRGGLLPVAQFRCLKTGTVAGPGRNNKRSGTMSGIRDPWSICPDLQCPAGMLSLHVSHRLWTYAQDWVYRMGHCSHSGRTGR